MKKVISILMVCFMLAALAGCQSNEIEGPVNSAPADERTQAPAETEAEAEAEAETETKALSYEEIYEEYAQKIRDAVPALVEEYNEEAANNTGGLTGLAALCNEKVAELAEIANEGVSEMAEVYFYSGSGSYEDYSEWADKIYDVYMEEATAIQDAYMESAK